MNDRSAISDEATKPSAVERQTLSLLPPAAALLEMVVLLIVPALLDYSWPPFPSLAEMHPHFFWLPVLLISLQYGTVSGLLAAGLAIALSAALGWPDQEIGENHFSYLLRIWAQPVLWLTAALLLGQFRTRQIEQKQDLAGQVEELGKQRKALADYATNLRSRCDALERELARRRDPSTRVLLNALGKLSDETVDARTQLSECLELALGPSQVGIFSRSGSSMDLVFRHGAGRATQPVRDQIPAGDPLFHAIVGDGRPLTVLTAGDEIELSEEGLAAVPIISRHSREVIGMLKLEAAEAAELDTAAPARLTLIADQIAPLLDTSASRTFSAAPVVPLPAAAVPKAPSRPRVWRQLKWVRRTDRKTAGAGSSTNFG